MVEGLTAELLWPAAVSWLIGLFVLRRYFPTVSSAAFALIKVLVPVIYFGWYFDGGWQLSDDISYFNQGSMVIERGFNPVSILFDPDGWSQLLSIVGSMHVLYVWWNVCAEYFFGQHYYSPVFLNIILLFAVTPPLIRLVTTIGFSPVYARWFSIFFLFHWDVLTWSSLLNLKDTMVLCLTIVAFFLITSLIKEFKVKHLLALAATLWIFIWLRFYTPVLILASTIVWLLVSGKASHRLFLVPIMAAGGWLVYTRMPNINMDLLQPMNLLDGLVRFLLTPQPWNVAESYSFLFVPSIFHWAFIVPALFSAIHIYRNFPMSRPLLFYALVILAFYGIFPDESGPRHRLQICFLLALCQFHFLWLTSERFEKQRIEPEPGSIV